MARKKRFKDVLMDLQIATADNDPEVKCFSCKWQGLENRLVYTDFNGNGIMYTVCPDCGQHETLEFL